MSRPKGTMTLKDISRKNGTEKNGSGDTTFDFVAFVAGHRATMEYLLKFGNPVERAKVSILFELAGVSL